jgi:hypothetical protein
VPLAVVSVSPLLSVLVSLNPMYCDSCVRSCCLWSSSVPASAFGLLAPICRFSVAIDAVSELTSLTRLVTCWFNALVCCAIWLDAVLKSVASVVAELNTFCRTELSEGLASSALSELKNAFMSVPSVVDAAVVEVVVMPKIDCRSFSAVLSDELDASSCVWLFTCWFNTGSRCDTAETLAPSPTLAFALSCTESFSCHVATSSV